MDLAVKPQGGAGEGFGLNVVGACEENRKQP